MQFVEITDLKNATDIKRIYLQSFIPAERIRFDRMFTKPFEGFRLFGKYENDKAVAMMHFIEKENFIHLNYFAVDQAKRSHGHGHTCLDWLKQKYPNKPIVVDVEELDESSYNSEYRQFRQNFYKSNGFSKGGCNFWWEGIFMTYMSTSPIDAHEFMEYIVKCYPTIKDIKFIK